MNKMKKFEIKNQAPALPVEEREQLASELWDSTLKPLTDEQKALLDERLAAYRANPNDVYPADEVYRAVRARLHQPL